MELLNLWSTKLYKYQVDKEGYKRGNIVERCYRDARAGALMGPSNDILKVIVGKRELGLSYPWEETKQQTFSEANLSITA